MKKETNLVKDNLFEIKKKLDNIIEALRKYDFNFNYHVVTNLNKVTDFNTGQEYICPNKTIILKDEADIEKGVGIIYNITEDNILVIGTLGVKYLNTKNNTRMTNEYQFINLNELNYFNDIYVNIINLIIPAYIQKYNITKNFNINIVPDIINAICN